MQIKIQPASITPAQAGIQRFGISEVPQAFLKIQGLDSRLRGNDGVRRSYSSP